MCAGGIAAGRSVSVLADVRGFERRSRCALCFVLAYFDWNPSHLVVAAVFVLVLAIVAFTR